MYSQFRVQNFRGFKDLELKDLARVNLIAGKNNVGKTALLEAIAIYSGRYDALLNRLPDDSYNDIWLKGRIAISNEFNWSLFFNQFDTKNGISLEATAHDDSVLMTVKCVPSSDVPVNSRLLRFYDDGTLGISRDALAFHIQNQIHYMLQLSLFSSDNHIPQHYVVYDSSGIIRKTLTFLGTRQYIDKSRLYGLFSDMRKNRQVEELLSILRIFDLKIQTVELLENGLYLDNGLPELIPLRNMGDGAIRVTEIVLTMSALQNGILLIDEIENGLHYSIQSDVWKAIAKAAELFNVQIFATTHSREMIQAAHEAFRGMPENSFRYHRLDRDKTGDIYATTYDEYSMSAAMETEAEIR